MVYPLIEEGEAPGIRSAADSYAELSRGVFRDIPCGLLHGKMTPAQKESVCASFREELSKFLFSTTVVEVGVDVPNAVLMVIRKCGTLRPCAAASAQGTRGAWYASVILRSVFGK